MYMKFTAYSCSFQSLLCSGEWVYPTSETSRSSYFIPPTSACSLILCISQWLIYYIHFPGKCTGHELLLFHIVYQWLLSSSMSNNLFIPANFAILTQIIEKQMSSSQQNIPIFKDKQTLATSINTSDKWNYHK